MRAAGHRAAFALLLAQAVVLAAWPWLGGTPVRQALAPGYSALCHQRPDRCYVHGGEPLPVCARCLGVWLGLLVAAGLAVFVGTGGRLWGWAAGGLLLGGMVASWALRLPAGWHLERTTAGVAGGVGVYVLAHRAWAAARRGPWRQLRFRRC